MTRESPTEESIISASLSSIIRKSLSKLASTVRLYDETRPALKRIIRSLEKERYKDKKSIDARKEQLRIWSYAILGYELLSTLADRIDTNPFPAERLTLRQIAFRLMPDLQTGVWFAIFSIYELCASTRYYFPADAITESIAEIESRLWQLAGGRVEVPLSEVVTEMGWNPNGKVYRVVKGELEQRGWVWKCVKRSGSVSRVVCVPQR
jgi:hypothetical protein